VQEHWATMVWLSETVVNRDKIEFDHTPASVRGIERVERNIAPLAPPDDWRVHECARVFAETGGKICETARRMNVCEKTVGRYLSLAIHRLAASLGINQGHRRWRLSTIAASTT
jgi:hypothetical protein